MTPPSSGWKPSGTSVATRTAAAAPPPVGPPSVAAPRLPSAPRERKPALAALALLLVVVGVLASVYLQIQARDEVGVIQVTKEVGQGQPITSADITEVMVAKNSAINYVLWSQEDLLAKYSAAANLVPGTILVGQMLTSQVSVNPNQVLIPMTLKPGDYPAGLNIGQTLTVYYVPGSAGAGAASGATVPQAGPIGTVTIVALPLGAASGNSDDVYTVSVDKSLATTMLEYSSANAVVLVANAAGN
ncbi:MAG TPA: hypothetical protein VGX23_13495 [Actinocrinis sp.]|nr:hypothetical protein [Actinocrinis sp.]